MAADALKVLKAIDTPAPPRRLAWRLAGEPASDRDASAEYPLVIGLDAILVTAHSDREHAKPTFKRGFGFHPLYVFIDHGPAGTGEPLAIMLRPGNAGSHITVFRQAFRQLPGISSS